MNQKVAGSVLAVLMAGGASPALADCCSGVFSCVATVVTYGVSCEVQTVIDTINSLVTEVNNAVSTTNGASARAVDAAKQEVSDTHDAMQTQAQQSSSALSSAASQAASLTHQETAPLVSMREQTTAPGMQGGTPAGGGSYMAQRPASVGQASQQAQTGGPPTADMVRAPGLAPAMVHPDAPAGAGQPTAQLGAVANDNEVKLSTLRPPHGAYGDLMRRAQKAVDALKQTGDADASKVNGYLVSAMNSEGPGLQTADQMISSVINAPLNALLSTLSQLLTHPWDVVAPSSAVDAMVKQVNDDLDYNLSQVLTDITTGPTANFDAAGPSFDDLQSSAEKAESIATAMQNLYQARTTDAEARLEKLVPMNLAVAQKAMLNGAGAAQSAGHRQVYAQLRAPILGRRQQAIVQLKSRTQPLHAALARFSSQRQVASTRMSPSMLQGYQATATQKLNGYFTGKTPAAIASQRDQLIAQARTQFANDPKTGSAVIDYLNKEAAKHSSAPLAAAPAALAATAVPVASVATRAAVPVGAMPAAGMQPAVPAAAMPAAGVHTATPVWGTAGAWKPPTAPVQPAVAAKYPNSAQATPVPAQPVVGTALKPVYGLRQQQPAPAATAPGTAPRPAPSSLGSN